MQKNSVLASRAADNQMFNLGSSQYLLSNSVLFKESKALLVLVFFHLLIITSSNYLVQIPINLGSIHTTWGAFTFPFIFLATDLTVRIFGGILARKIIFFAMLPALIISYVISVLFKDTNFQGLAALNHVDYFVLRIAVASFTAYCVGQLLDIYVFNGLRQKRSWWVAPSVSTLIGNAIDAILFFSIAFYKSDDAFMSTHWTGIAAMDYATRIVICFLFFLPAYGMIINALVRYLKSKQTAV